MLVRVTGDFQRVRLYTSGSAPEDAGPRPLWRARRGHGWPAAGVRGPAIREMTGGSMADVPHALTRRQLLARMGAAGALSLGGAKWLSAAPPAPTTSPVSIARCPSYDGDLATVLNTMFDQIGGIGPPGQGQDGCREAEPDRRRTGLSPLRSRRHVLGEREADRRRLSPPSPGGRPAHPPAREQHYRAQPGGQGAGRGLGREAPEERRARSRVREHEQPRLGDPLLAAEGRIGRPPTSTPPST